MVTGEHIYEEIQKNDQINSCKKNP